MPETELTTVQITKKASSMLAELASAERRSKTGQIEYMIEREHQRIFNDGENAHAPTEESSYALSMD